MSKRPSSFRTTDVKRMVRAAESAGMKVASVEFETRTAGSLSFRSPRPERPEPQREP